VAAAAQVGAAAVEAPAGRSEGPDEAVAEVRPSAAAVAVAAVERLVSPPA
jgi:hypothetical protein